MQTEDPVSFDDARVIRETEKAVLVACDDFPGERTRWIPKSVIHDDSEVCDEGENSEGRLVLKGWWAAQEGLS